MYNNRNTSIEATMATRSAVPSRPAPNPRPATESRAAAHPRSVGNPASTPLNGLANTSINTHSCGRMSNHIQSPEHDSAPRSSDARNYYGVTNNRSVPRSSDDARNYPGFTNSSVGNRAYGLTDGPANSVTHGPAYGTTSGPTYGHHSNITNNHDTSSSLWHAPVPKHEEDEDQEAKQDDLKHDQPKLVETEDIFYNQFESQV
ncbi:hypothetical protein PG991_011862 [Apiospora marii]|uniref:Uncharacterized protein n=1 Tax=Apiospora marii TaxID=335849 RepID=A0ABR1RFE4_9PEZI